MTITYQTESWSQCVEEMSGLWELHWQEIALDRQKVKLEPDFKTIEILEESGQLSIVTVRDDGKLVGYHASLIRPHLHYKSSLTAYVDMYFLHPDYRSGMAGYKMFKFVEGVLKSQGVERIYSGTKLHKDMGKLFERLGYNETERLFVKWIGD
jgi:N-acetylglutamate synthase-like GNAT family acetyltransferase